MSETEVKDEMISDNNESDSKEKVEAQENHVDTKEVSQEPVNSETANNSISIKSSEGGFPQRALTAADVDSILGHEKSPENHQDESNEKENDDKNGKEDEEPSAGPSTSEPAPNAEADAENSLGPVPFARTSHNRVKLYVLCEKNAWDDKGTGHVACVRNPKKPEEWFLVVRLENEANNMLESRITDGIQYQRQQGTLIVWSENETVDLALSFQEKQGCEDIFYNIMKIQDQVQTNGGDNLFEDDVESDSSDNGNNWGQTIALPQCDVPHISEIETLISSSMSSSNTREIIANSILRAEYIPKLCDMFEMAEASDDQTTLASLASISKDMFLLNNQALLNDLIAERCFRHFIGMLEYDASLRKPKKHRQFLYDRAQFKEILPIPNEELKNKISETYRLQYLHDVCLPAPSLFEENLLQTLASTLFFNRVEILSKLMADKPFVKQFFKELKDKNTPLPRLKDLIAFLKEFFYATAQLQQSTSQAREQTFNLLMENDGYQILDPVLSSNLPSAQPLVVELLSYFLEFSLVPFRQFMMKHNALDVENLLLNKILRCLVHDRDPEFNNARNMAENIRNILDPEAQPRGDFETFCQYFYEKSVPYVCKPIIENVQDGKLVRDDYYMCRQFCMISTMLIFCIKSHTANMRSYILKNRFLNSVVVFLKSKHHLNGLKVLRMIRRILDLRDETYITHIRDEKLFTPIVEAFNANGHRYNLLNSTFLDLFEGIQQDNIGILIDHIGKEHLASLEQHNYVRTFALIKRKYEKRKEDEAKRLEQQQQRAQAPVKQLPERLLNQFEKEKRFEDDDVFFNGDDDEGKLENGISEGEASTPSSSKATLILPMRKSGAEINFPSLGKRRNAEDEGVASIFGGTATTPSINKSNNKITIKIGGVTSSGVSPSSPKEDLSEPPIRTILNPRYRKSSLVNYDDSDSDDDDEGKSKSAPASVSVSPVNDTSPPKKKLKVIHQVSSSILG